MVKRRRSRTEQDRPIAVDERQVRRLWERPWFAPLLFALLSVGYFSDVVLTDKIVYGYDVGGDLHQGAGMGFVEKLGTVSQPMWNSQMGGFPSSEEIRPQYFPTYLLYLFTTFQRHVAWRYILMMLAAGWGMFCFIRGLGLGRWSAIWAGVAYMSAPTFLAFTFAGHYAKMGVIALFPWMVLMLLHAMERRRLVHAALLGGLIGLGIYSPHPQMLYHALLGLGLFFLYFVGQRYLEERDWRRAATRTGLFAFAVSVGIGLGAEGVIPLFNYVRTESKRAATGEVADGVDVQLARARSYSLHQEEVVSLVIPEFGGFANPAQGRDYYWGRNPFKHNAEYFGIVAVLLALVGVCLPARGSFAVFLAGLFIIVLAYTMGGHTPVHTLAFYLLPGAKVMRALGMAAFVFAFAAITLGAMGFHRVLSSGDDAAEDGGMRAESAISGRTILTVGAALTGLGMLVALAPKSATDFWIALVYSSISPEKQGVLANGYAWLARGGLLVAAVSAAATCLLWLRTRGQLAVVWVGAGLCLLTVVDTWRIDRVFLRYEDPARFTDVRTENQDVVGFLEDSGDLTRIFPLPDFSLTEQPGYHLYGVPMVTGFNNFTLKRYDRVLAEFDPVVGALKAKYRDGMKIPYSDAELLNSVAPMLDLLNASHIVGPRGIQLESSRYPLVYTGARYQAHRNATSMPYFYLTPEYRITQDEEQAIQWLRSGEIDLRREAVLEQEPGVDFALRPDGAPTQLSQDHVEPLESDLAAGRIVLRASCGGPRILVISHNYHPNWSVKVDGQRRQLLRANYVWQAVSLPAGQHDVELTYRSATMLGSRLASVLSLLLIGSVVGAASLSRRRRIRAGAAVEPGAVAPDADPSA
jgi:hypothetical protein